MKVIDISGFSFTGKSAVHGFLSEFEGVVADNIEFEFDFIRTSSGVADLYNALVENWSPIRSSEVIRESKYLVKRLGGTRSLKDRLVGSGSSYDYYMPGFSDLANVWLDSLILYQYNSYWPYSNFKRGLFKSITLKILRKIGFSLNETVYLSRLSEEEFILRTHKFFTNLFHSKLTGDKHTLLLNNCFESFEPSKYMKFVPESYSVVVDRDPRDVYISAASSGLISGVNVGSTTLGKNVEQFVSRYKIFRNTKDITCNKVIKLYFEDLIDDYENTKNMLVHCLELNDHINKNCFFSPVNSSSNIRQWLLPENKIYKDQIIYIEQELSDYLIKD